jgi:hypothetical protein
MDSEGIMAKLPFRFPGGITLCLLTILFSACSPPTPSPASPFPVVTIIPADYTRPIQTSSVPTLNPDLTCDQVSDCAFAYRTDTCCACGAITNRNVVENTRFLRYVHEPEDYTYMKSRLPQLVCPGVMCAPCRELPFGLVCDAGSCREARTWQEILSACDSDMEKGKWCRITAAATALKAGDKYQAVTICTDMSGDHSSGNPYSEECFLNLARTLKEKDPLESAAFCRDHMHEQLSTCLNEAGEALSHSDLEAGLALCREIAIENTNARNQQDFCFHNIAMGVASKDLEYAKRICELMSERVQECKETAARQP